MKHLCALLLLLSFVAICTASCPVYLRVLNSVTPNAEAHPGEAPQCVSLYVNDRRLINSVPFRKFSDFVAVTDFESLTFVVKNQSGAALYPPRTFRANPGTAWTVVVSASTTYVAGAISGPNVVFDTPPYVIAEDILPPNPGRIRGTWYRMSQTSAFVDLRVVPSSFDLNTPNSDAARLLAQNPKTATKIPELIPGTYTFLPAVSTEQRASSPSEAQGDWSYTPVLNAAINEIVAVQNLTVSQGVLVYIAATGLALGTTGPAGRYSLQLSHKLETPTYNRETGCVHLAGVGAPVSFGHHDCEGCHTEPANRNEMNFLFSGMIPARR